MQFHFHANQSHFHKNGFALRLALKQRHKGTRKWPIEAEVKTQGERVDECVNEVVIGLFHIDQYKLYNKLQ